MMQFLPAGVYTTRAENTILEVFPETILPMNEEQRKYKYG